METARRRSRWMVLFALGSEELNKVSVSYYLTLSTSSFRKTGIKRSNIRTSLFSWIAATNFSHHQQALSTEYAKQAPPISKQE